MKVRWQVWWLVCGWCLAGCVVAATLPDLALRDTAGHMHTRAQYRGQWLIVNYWAPWCPPCLEEMPALETFYDAHRQHGVMVIGVAVQYETVKSVTDFVQDMLVSYPIVLGESQVQAIQRPEVLPTTYIYRPDGRLYQIKRGAVSRQWLEQLLGNAGDHPLPGR